MTARELFSAVAYFRGVCPHQLDLLSNRDILQPVHARVAEIWTVHGHRGGFGHHYRARLLLLEPHPWLTRRIGSSVCEIPRIRLICLHRLGERDGVAWRGRVSYRHAQRRIRNRDTRFSDTHGGGAAPSEEGSTKGGHRPDPCGGVE
jgi:hypothetical protein